MSSIDLNAVTPVSSPIRSASDVARLINTVDSSVSHARMIVLLALGGVFLDAYDLTTLSYGIDDVAREFGLTPALTGLVGSAIMIGTIFGSLIGGWLTDKIGRYQVFMADMLFFVVAAIAAGLAPNVWVLIGARFVMGPGRHRPAGRDGVSRGISKFNGRGNKGRGSRRGARCGTWRRRPASC